MKKNQHTIGRQALFILSLILSFQLIQSCQKEEHFGFDTQISPQARLLGESRVFFEQQISGQRLQVMPNNPRHRAGKIPLWDQAEKVQLSIGEGLKVPLRYREPISLLIVPNQEAVSLAELSYLLVYKDQQGRYQYEVVTQVPNADYWVHRHETGRSFSGIVIVEDWWGRPIKTFKKVSAQHYILLGNPVLSTKPRAKKSDEPQNLVEAADDCDVIVTEDERHMYNVEYICHEHPGGGGDGGGNSGEGGGSGPGWDNPGGGGWGIPGGLGGWGNGGGDVGGGGGGGYGGPQPPDYEERPRGGGGGRRNENPPAPEDEISVVEPSEIDMTVIDTANLQNYPRFKSIIKNIPAFLHEYPNITKALAYYTGFSNAKVIELMQPGKGPKVEIIPNLTDRYGHPVFGYYDKAIGTLQIKESWVRGLDAAQSPSTIQATGLLLLITTFHEFVHYGRDQNKLLAEIIDPITHESYEAGFSFEMDINPNREIINKNNAINWISFYPYNFQF